jgi:hypothetical protein
MNPVMICSHTMAVSGSFLRYGKNNFHNLVHKFIVDVLKGKGKWKLCQIYAGEWFREDVLIPK